MSWFAYAVKIRFKRSRWGWGVYYGSPRWPSNSFWIVPGTVREIV